jgi:hypothetical protein
LRGRDSIDDVLIGTPAADRFYGEQHNGAHTIDTVSYERSNVEVTVNLAIGTGQGGHAEGDRYFGIENVVGSGLGERSVGTPKTTSSRAVSATTICSATSAMTCSTAASTRRASTKAGSRRRTTAPITSTGAPGPIGYSAAAALTCS